MAKRGLGKGLEALIPGAGMFGGRAIQEVHIDSLSTNDLQPRTHVDEEKIEELAESIRRHGILQPLIVRRKGEGFEIIAGERRWRAAKKAGLKAVPVIVEEADEEKKLELALVENLQREDLNPIELARGIRKLMDIFGLTQEEVAERIGKKRPTVANVLRLLELPQGIQKLLEEGVISLGHAKALLGLSLEEQEEVVERIVGRSLSVRETETLIRERKRKIRREEEVPRVREEENVEHLLVHYLATRVRVGRGRIVIEYQSLEDLKRLYSLIVRPE
ncbi:MAG: ParB/RepB/Spo0J family partition protein [Candidatus Caldatribacteriaceae bacterium]